MNPSATRHAERRMAQRGFKADDIDIIIGCGTLLRPGFHFLRARDVDREIRDCKRRIQALERLRGSAAVVESGELVTCFHVSGTPGRRALRGRHMHRRRTKRQWMR